MAMERVALVTGVVLVITDTKFAAGKVAKRYRK
jgi:hypothetical protein